MSMNMIRSFGLAAVCALVMACGGDEEKDAEKCPATFVAGQTQVCACGDAGAGIQTCLDDGNLTECDCTGGGGTAGTTAGTTGTAGTTAGTTGTGVAGTTGTTAGTGASNVDGGTAGSGETPDGGGGGDTDGGGSGGGDKPKDDGTQLSTCGASNPCEGDLTCYTANATSVGYCTTTCTVDDDCKDLSGATYTCSSGGECRIACDGVDDDSCPADMNCTEVMGGFRCLYDEKDVGDGKAKIFEECTVAGDCSGDLVCYNPIPQGAPLPGGSSYTGHCAQPCAENSECTDEPSSGTAMLGCSTSSGACRLTCGGGGGGGGGTCPDGMTCVPGINRCAYADSTGGI
jgi:hypothetical protein